MRRRRRQTRLRYFWARLPGWFREAPAPARRIPVPPQARYPVPAWTEDDDDRTQLGLQVTPFADGTPPW